jgi:hypothetical protein
MATNDVALKRQNLNQQFARRILVHAAIVRDQVNQANNLSVTPELCQAHLK